MSYYAIFKPTKEAVDGKRKSVHFVNDPRKYGNECRLDMLVYCMGETDSDSVHKVCANLQFQMDYMRNLVRGQVWKHAFETFDEEGEIWYCGWTYAKSEPDTTYEELCEYVMHELVLLKNVKTPDYFDDNEKYFEKVSGIDGKIEYFTDTCRELAIFEVMDYFSDYRAGEDDGGDDDGECGEGGVPDKPGCTEEGGCDE